MRKGILLLVAFSACAALGAAKKLPECTFTVTPRGGDSQISKSGGGLIRSMSSTSNNNQSKTITRNLKWLAEVRIRENRPEKLELKAYYIGEVNGGQSIKQLGTESKVLDLDKNGRASVELTSPTTRLTKSRTSSSSGNSGFRSTKKRISGERVVGCVVQLFADGEFLKGWSSDSRWASAANKAPFSVAELAKEKTGKIGLR